eukprot:1462081-Amphidinium_carterae.1
MSGEGILCAQLTLLQTSRPPTTLAFQLRGSQLLPSPSAGRDPCTSSSQPKRFKKKLNKPIVQPTLPSWPKCMFTHTHARNNAKA